MRGSTLTAVTFSLAAAGSRRASGVICACRLVKPGWKPRLGVTRSLLNMHILKNSSQGLKFNAQTRREIYLRYCGGLVSACGCVLISHFSPLRQTHNFDIFFKYIDIFHIIHNEIEMIFYPQYLNTTTETIPWQHVTAQSIKIILMRITVSLALQWQSFNLG